MRGLLRILEDEFIIVLGQFQTIYTHSKSELKNPSHLSQNSLSIQPPLKKKKARGRRRSIQGFHSKFVH